MIYEVKVNGHVGSKSGKERMSVLHGSASERDYGRLMERAFEVHK